jgi:RNA polymerase sigma-54 factor
LKISISHSLCQSQKQILNWEMKLSLDILSMDICALRELILRTAESNPFIEIDFSNPSHRNLDQTMSFCNMLTTYNKEIESNVPMFVFDDNDDYKGFYNERTYNFEGSINSSCQEPTFTDMLEEQIRWMNLNDELSELCICLIGYLNSKGYLDTSLDDIAHNHCANIADVKRALRIVQSLHPAGVGARSLKECLILQLKDRNQLTACTEILVKQGLAALANNDLTALSKLLKTNISATISACRLIRSLNPIPSQGFRTGEDPIFVIPDASVRFEEGSYVIATNNRILPKITLNREYCQLLKASSEEEIGGIKRYLPVAKAMIRGINNRRSTFLNVLQCIIGMQPTYFKNGSDLKAMDMQSVAEVIGIHPSTVSRAVSNKYIACEKGIVSLRSLFDRGVPLSSSVNGTIAVSIVKQELGKLISTEDQAAPLSDNELCDILAAKGYKISRRTVTKYRENMGVPCSYQRKATYAIH